MTRGGKPRHLVGCEHVGWCLRRLLPIEHSNNRQEDNDQRHRRHHPPTGPEEPPRKGFPLPSPKLLLTSSCLSTHALPIRLAFIDRQRSYRTLYRIENPTGNGRQCSEMYFNTKLDHHIRGGMMFERQRGAPAAASRECSARAERPARFALAPGVRRPKRRFPGTRASPAYGTSAARCTIL